MIPITHTSRTGDTYYLHTGPKSGGGVQHYFSTKSTGNLAEQLPEGFEVYESVRGQVFLRRQQPKLIRNGELDGVARRVEKPRAGHRYKIEVRGKVLTIHESAPRSLELERFALPFPQERLEALAERFAYYQPVLSGQAFQTPSISALRPANLSNPWSNVIRPRPAVAAKAAM